jgi:prefoldin subunit 5
MNDQDYENTIWKLDNRIEKLEAENNALRTSNTDYQRLYNEMAEAYSKQKRELGALRKELMTEIQYHSGQETHYRAERMRKALQEQGDE